MVLPLLGLAGLAVGSAALPYVQNFQDERRREYQEGIRADALAGVNVSDPGAVANALFGAGIMAPDEFQRDVRTGFESEADRAAAMARQRVASGPAYMNAETNRLRLQADLQAMERQQELDAANRAIQENWAENTIQNYGTPFEREQLSNPFTPSQVKTQLATGIFDRYTTPEAPPDPFGGDTATNRITSRIEGLQSSNVLLQNIDAGISDWVETVNKPTLTPGEQATRLQTERDISDYIRQRYAAANNGAEMNDEAFQAARELYPMPQRVGGQITGWLLRGESISGAAVREFWKRELARSGQALVTQRQALSRQRGGLPPRVDPPDLGLIPGSTME